jgi:hypothetical protein
MTPIGDESNKECLLWSCHIADIGLASERHVNYRVIPMWNAVNESVDLVLENYNRVFRKEPPSGLEN